MLRVAPPLPGGVLHPNASRDGPTESSGRATGCHARRGARYEDYTPVQAAMSTIADFAETTLPHFAVT